MATSLHVNESASDVRSELSADVLFEFDKATLSDKAQDALQQTTSIIREKAKGQVRIDGYTDAKGDEQYIPWFPTLSCLRPMRFLRRARLVRE